MLLHNFEYKNIPYYCKIKITSYFVAIYKQVTPTSYKSYLLTLWLLNKNASR